MKNIYSIFLGLFFLSGCLGTKPFERFNVTPPLVDIWFPSFHPNVYYFDQTVACVLENFDNKIVKCDIVEADKPEELTNIMEKIPESYKVASASFSEIKSVINQCEVLDAVEADKKNKRDDITDIIDIFRGNPFDLLTGIIPDTKWCGPGNIADNYQDLGNNSNLDSCCRSHDLCPTKIRSKTKRYDIFNNADYTISHCDCDEAFYKCLKNLNTSKANIIGNLYFNIIKMQCIRDQQIIVAPLVDSNITIKKLDSIQKSF